MNVYKYTYTYVQIDIIYTNIHTSTHTYIQTHKYIQINTYKHAMNWLCFIGLVLRALLPDC